MKAFLRLFLCVALLTAIAFAADRDTSVLMQADRDFAKATAAKRLEGYPVSAVLASKDVLSVFQPGDHGSTFGGNPLACAVARAALRVLVEESLIERSAELGDYFLNKLRTLRSPHLRAVRGKGLWIGIELNVSARPYCEALQAEGVLCKETHEYVIRVAPPLVITREEIDWAFERIRRVVEGLA
jgi:ornithine--oxo-acid transaminase